MRRDDIRHPKTNSLMRQLNASRPLTLGYLTLLFDFVCDHARQGDVGKWDDGAIAQACEFDGDAADFVEALVQSGHLATDDKCRRYVVDWPAICPGWVKAILTRQLTPFHDVYMKD